MSVRLAKDVILTAGISDMPVDLVSKSAGTRVPLSEEEAALAMILTDGAPEGKELVQLAARHGIMSDLPTIERFLRKLEDARFLDRLLPPPAPSVPPPAPPPPSAFSAEDLEDDQVTTLDLGVDIAQRLAPLVPAYRRDLVLRELPDGSVEITDPLARTRQRLSKRVLQLAQLFNGQRTTEDVAAAAAKAGLHVDLTSLERFVTDLQTRGIVGRVPLDRPPAPARPAPAAVAAAVPPAVPAAPPPAAPRPSAALPQPDEPSPVRPLATAAVLMRDGRHEAAEVTLLAVLGANPQDVHAQAMLDLIRSMRRASRRRARVVAAMVLGMAVVVIGTVVALLAITVPRTATLVCQPSHVPLATVRSPQAGRLANVSTRPGSIVAKGQLLAVLALEDRDRRLAEAREQVQSQTDLLRIMRTGGTDEDERTAKRQLGTAAAELTQLRVSCTGSSCPQAIARLQARVEVAKTKLKFCQWQGLPKEIKAGAQTLEELQRRLTAVEREPSQLNVTSPARGLVAEVAAVGALAAGAQVAALVDADRVRITAQHDGQAPAPSATVKLTTEQGTETYLGQAVTGGGRVQVAVEIDARRVRTTTECTVTLSLGRRSLLRRLIE